MASISSRVRPFVSGTMKYMKIRDAMAITPNPANRIPVPTNACYTKKDWNRKFFFFKFLCMFSWWDPIKANYAPQKQWKSTKNARRGLRKGTWNKRFSFWKFCKITFPPYLQINPNSTHIVTSLRIYKCLQTTIVN